jgi:hypothetical protein
VLGASVKYPQPSLKVRPFSEICYTSTLYCKVLVIFTQILYTLMLFRYGMVTKAWIRLEQPERSLGLKNLNR